LQPAGWDVQPSLLLSSQHNPPVCPALLSPRRLSIKPDNPPKDDPLCIFCVRKPSANGLALSAFVDYALTKPAVRFITYSDLVRWMQVGFSWGVACVRAVERLFSFVALRKAGEGFQLRVVCLTTCSATAP
jgi:hypothetical protein